MSRIIIVINNSLKYDSRVRRQATVFAEVFDEVVICASPYPDRVEHIQGENITWRFLDGGDDLTNETLRSLCRSLELYDQLACIVPSIIDNDNYDKGNISLYKEMRDIIMSPERWSQIREGIPMELALKDEVPWMHGQLGDFLRRAETVSKIPADVVYCNDVDTLLCGVVHKRKYNSRFIYDQHDILADNSGGYFPIGCRYMFAMLEYEFIKTADALIGIGWAFLDWIRSTYNISIPAFVIPNCKEFQYLDTIEGQKACKQIGKPIRLYYHGILRKGVEPALEAIAKRDRFVLTLRCVPSGYSNYLNELKARVESEGFQDKVIFLDPAPPTEVSQAAFEGGDIGLFIAVDQSVGTTVSLTNKFIEYLNAGLPVITSSICKDQARILLDYQAGFVIDDLSGDSINSILDEIELYPDKLYEMSKNAARASRELFEWGQYKELLVSIAKNEAVFETTPATVAGLTDEMQSMYQELAAWKSANVCIFEAYAGVRDGIRRQVGSDAEKDDVKEEMEALRQAYHALRAEHDHLLKRTRLLRKIYRLLKRIFKRKQKVINDHK